ncbi:MAG TPA: BON domain-containing protein [Chryseolinea sp.]|nr:BON domain-containing protein [Chryseolinea sp.]
MKKIATLVLSLALMASLFSCQPNDEKIDEAAKTALAGNAALSGVSASVQDGVVTLSGEVENDELKSLAQTTLVEIKGVKSVVNNVTVKPQGPTPEELKQMSDSALQAKVTEAFTRYKVSGVTATVVDSVVTLTGDIKRADLQNAMKAANEAAPKKVENKLNIK